MDEKLAKVLDEGRSTKQPYLNKKRLFQCDPKHNENRRGKVMVAREKRVVSRIRQDFEEDGDNGSPFAVGTLGL